MRPHLEPSAATDRAAARLLHGLSGMIERIPQGVAMWGGEITGRMMAEIGALPFLIWSGEHRAYWRPSGHGYTADTAAAGRWTFAEAYFATKHCGPEKAISLQPIDYVRLDLPLPTSVNGLFIEAPSRKATGKGKPRVKTREYKAWIDAAGWMLKPQLAAQGAPIMPETPTFGRHWALWIRVNIDHTGDVTNRIKALEDLLVSWKITVGDQWNDRCTVERDRTLDVECRVIIYRKVQP
jgi:hypothetical protein